MAETLTTNYEFVKPEIGIVGSPSQWSERLNEDLDAIDAAIKDIQDQIDVLVPDAPEEAGPRLETLERRLAGKLTLRRIEINTSTSITLGDGPADAIWITATGSGTKTLSLSAPTPDQEVDGTADGLFVMQEGQFIIQNFGSGSISFVGVNATIRFRDGDGGSISGQGVPGGLLRYYRWLAFHSSGSSETPPESVIYMWRVAV